MAVVGYLFALFLYPEWLEAQWAKPHENSEVEKQIYEPYKQGRYREANAGYNENNEKAIPWVEKAASQDNARAKKAITDLREKEKAGSSAFIRVADSEDLWPDLIERLERFPEMKFRIIRGSKSFPTACKKIVVLNTASRLVYSGGMPRGYCMYEFNREGIELILEGLRSQGKAEEYSDRVLYEIWF